MKRIIDGVTYNTDTSTLLAKSEYSTEYNHVEYPCEGRLYQTRGGAFFVHEVIDLGYDRELDERVIKYKAEAFSAEKAQKWIMSGDTEVFHNPFEDPPEAQAEAEPSATIYVRVPASLKQRLEHAASAEKLSGNSWAIRCIEQCLAPDERVRANIGRVWWLAGMIRHNEDEEYSSGTIRNIAERIQNIIENNWKPLRFAEGRFDQDIADLSLSNDYARLSDDFPKAEG
ncbi:hypothetical protein [Methylocystis sp.]|uniref:hypothetical protein n=1 Tax=Methylocystis sp. TaxID=1911079 RepID=UPI003DA1F6ED